MNSNYHIPIVGEKYNLLTVVSDEISITKDKQRQFFVQCECGQKMWVRAHRLVSNRTKGCRACSGRKSFYEYKSRQSFLNKGHEGIGDFTRTFYCHIKRGAKVRDILWDNKLTLKYLYELFLKQNKKCALSGLEIYFSSIRSSNNPDYNKITASLDRIDSSKGYIEENIQWVHKDVNKMKNKFDQEYFIKLCSNISENRKHDK